MDKAGGTTPRETPISGIFRNNLIAFLGDDDNGIHQLYADTITAKKQLCVDKADGTPVCVTGDQLAAVLAGQGGKVSATSTAGQGSVGVGPTIKHVAHPDYVQVSVTDIER